MCLKTAIARTKGRDTNVVQTGKEKKKLKARESVAFSTI